MIHVRIARTQPDWATARRLVEEYAASLGVDLGFQHFEHEMENLAQEYGPPAGVFLLADSEDGPLGCVALRPLTGDTCEMKRLYVVPAGRGRGAGRTLAEAIVRQGIALGYRRMVLDTLPGMANAQALYRSLGFTPTEPYRFNPIPGSAFLELALRNDVARGRRG